MKQKAANWQDLKHCQDFEDLYSKVWETISHCHGIGRCTAYDTALRLAYALGGETLLPKEYVYVHGHLITTANDILGVGHIGKGYIIPPDVFRSRRCPQAVVCHRDRRLSVCTGEIDGDRI